MMNEDDEDGVHVGTVAMALGGGGKYCSFGLIEIKL